AGFARRLGRTCGTLAAEMGRRVVCVGRDCRLTSDRYAAAVAAGIVSAGVSVLDLGVCPTPLMYFSLFHWDLDGGIQVTGSHNPADYNGFKVCLGTEALHGEQIQDLRRRLEAGKFKTGRGAIERRPVGPVYQEDIARRVGRLAREIDVVLDAGNGTAGPVAPGIYRRLGARVRELFCDPDGRFPNHHPDPTVADNMRDLIRTVAETGAELGIAFDGDADRIGVTAAKGHILWKEQYFGYDDAIYAGARRLDILARSGKRVDQLLADLPPSHTTPEIRVECPDDVKFAVAERVRDRFRAAGREIVDVDGVRVRFPHGWGLVRASNTQPVLVMRF